MDSINDRFSEYLTYLIDKRGLPSASADSLANYIYFGREPGGFMTAVLENDLVGSFSRADDQNINLMYMYAQIMYMDVPVVCRGSREVVREWMTGGGMAKREAEQ